MTRDDGGFSLVELLAALTVLALGVFGTMQVFVGTLRTTSEASMRTRGTALASREVETMRAIPYDNLGFGTGSGAPATFEGSSTVFVDDSVAQTTPAGAPETIAGTRYSIARNVVWVSKTYGGVTNPQAFKRVTAVVSWTGAGGARSVRQDDTVYPGGRGPYTTACTGQATISPPGVNLLSDGSQDGGYSGNYGNGRLARDIYVSIAPSGTCSNLRMRFSPQQSPVTVTMVARAGGVWDYTIGRNTYYWSVGNHTITILDASDRTVGTVVLWVCPPGPQCP